MVLIDYQVGAKDSYFPSCLNSKQRLCECPQATELCTQEEETSIIRTFGGSSDSQPLFLGDTGVGSRENLDTLPSPPLGCKTGLKRFL